MSVNPDAAERRLRARLRDLETTRESGHEANFGADQREMTGELSTLDQHPADTADFTFQRELELSTERILEHEGEQAREAMRLIEQGRYGQCQNCGRQISEERLQARPEATLCIQCQRTQEAAG